MRRDDMRAMPEDASELGRKHFTGITCPDCSGAIGVHAEGRAQLVLECRIGHVYSVAEMIFAKEKRAETLVWAAISALEELAAFLRDTGADPVRAEGAVAEAAALRRVLEGVEPARIELP
ncbi:MAG: hypothetical protein QM820_41510 [Minicystis sp.]